MGAPKNFGKITVSTSVKQNLIVLFRKQSTLYNALACNSKTTLTKVFSRQFYEILKTPSLIGFVRLLLNLNSFSEFSLREKYPYLEVFWLVYSSIWTENREIRSIFPYSVRMRENEDQKNSG